MIRWFLPVLATAGLVFAGWSSTHPAGPAQILPAPPPTAAFSQRIAGTGLVEAASQNLALSGDLAETIAEVLVRVGDEVPAGAPLVRLDDREATAAVATAQARVAAANARINAAKTRLEELKAQPRAEDLPPAQANVARARVALAEAADREQRGESAAAGKAIADEELARRRFARSAAAAELAKVEADLAKLQAGAWAPQIASASAEVDSATADQASATAELARSQATLARYTLKAPIAGRILQCNARPGERTAPGSRNLVILGDCRQLHIRAQVDERDAARLKPGASAMAIPRGEPQRRIPLTFVRVEPLVIPKRSLTGDSSERVDTRILEVLYSAGEDSALFTGQQVDVEIDAGVVSH